MIHTSRRSPIALTVLALLAEAPMHTYRMQQLIKQRGKDAVIDVRQRAGLYQTIARLQRDGLVAVRETTREERWPERTVYELTDDGRRTVRRWIREILATPAWEYPEFPAAIAFLPLLAPDDALRQLETRAAVLADEVARIDDDLHGAAATLPRLFLLETEYLRTARAAELAWVRAIIADLRSGQLTWSAEWLRAMTAAHEPGATNT